MNRLNQHWKLNRHTRELTPSQNERTQTHAHLKSEDCKSQVIDHWSIGQQMKQAISNMI